MDGRKKKRDTMGWYVRARFIATKEDLKNNNNTEIVSNLCVCAN